MTTQPAAKPYEEEILTGRFEGKTVIVTGAASGIGLATTLRIAREGGRVIAVDLNEEGLAALKEEHANRDIVTVTADIGENEDVARVIEACNGQCDGLANNAGIMDKFVPIGEVSDEMWEKVFHVNVLGTMKMTRAVIPLMLGAGHGSICNTASMGGIVGGAAGAAYTASKFAVVGITKNTSFMYAPNNIRVNAVAPGAVRTNIGGDFASHLALARVGPRMQVVVPPPAAPEEIAAAITFLLSDDSANVTGAVLPSDGGWSAA
ncbi:SDR family NAD(P)-dependent oxidoreductase [Ancrocorticia populi]|uniref:SDR family NAD(P)-dependent oxidoreductase n=1 Tax=Ancrocorticia populi TaxID=2175228 RepID=UPI002355EB14|nr:SDR family NAD(P)-dependent oxidoreductase [Ancrocorticia populi]